MTPQNLIDECQKSGVTIYLAAGALKLRGTPDAVKSMAARMRPYKTDLLAHLANSPSEIAGPYTPFVCGISVEIVRDLHALIFRYANQFQLSDEAAQRIISAAKCQALSTVLASVEFFTNAIRHTTN